ncbi:SPOSA6832_03971 [Sporobolomyces salmonicolor]|uniref:SPOSA6832_03971-mRNA-1:cds n=1 Tax=Sporidiobolus salmonicolor TaxID=5005 RepID=A0A0D6EQF8_SPOSA|nr:SPOSA6832_03971 [Sporobolomyces salmonicolor]
MSRDRLREARNQQQGYQQAPSGYGQQPSAYGGGGGYAPQPAGGYGGGGFSGGYGAPQQSYAPPPGPPAGYAQDYAPPVANGNGAYAMQPMNTSGVPAPGGDLGPFFAEVESIQDEIKQLHSNITNVSDLHSRRLASTGDDALQAQTAQQLTQLTNATSALTNSIRNRITKLNDQNKRSVAGDPNFATRKLQIANLQNSFKRGLEEYNLVEKRSRDKYRQRMERQIKIVKPDATQEEIKAAFDDSQGGAQIFSQASRNQDLRKIEETITQLAQMMQDDESVRAIETQAVQVNTDVEQGLQQTKKAVKSARAARRKRWICFFILLAIIIVVVVVVVVEVLKNQNK